MGMKEIKNETGLKSGSYAGEIVSVSVIDQLLASEDDQFAQSLYKVLLNREAEISSLNNIRISLDAGNSKHDIILGVLKSDEFANVNKAVDEEVYRHLNKGTANGMRSVLQKIRRLSRVHRLKCELQEMRQKSVHQEEILRESFVKIYDILKQQNADWRKWQEGLDEQQSGLKAQQEGLKVQQEGLKAQQEGLKAQQEGLKAQQDELRNQQRGFEEKQNSLEKQQNSTMQYYQQLSSENNEQRQTLNELLISMNSEIELEDILETEGILGEVNIDEFIDTGIQDNNEKFYSTLGNLFRGDYNSIIEKQKNYIKYIDLSLIEENDVFIDLGCGRGEFLEILKSNGVHGQGVDLNGAIIEGLRTKGLDAVQMDIYEYLEQLKDDSIAGASAFQVIEHLEFDQLKKIVQLAYKKIKTNGTLILETVNPYCIWGLGSYYIDPTHIKLYVADTMKTLLWIEGFRDIKIIYYAPISKELRTEANIFANYAGYAIIGKKGGQAERVEM